MSHQPPAEDILAQARQQVAARQQALIAQRWRETPWLLLTLVGGVLLIFFLTPGMLPQKLLWAMSGVCGLRPTHSYFAGGLQFPLEARMVGIYGGFAITLIMLLCMRRAGTQRLGSRPIVGVLALLFASMVVDGINSTLFEIHAAYLYMPTNPLRLITGLLAGIALAPLLLWLISSTTLPCSANEQAVLRSPWDIAMALLLNALFGALVVSGWAGAYYPVALLSVAGIVTSLAIAAFLLIMLASGMQRRVIVGHQLLAPGALALLSAFAFLAAMATVRWMSTGSLL